MTGLELKIARITLALTQAQLAEKLGVYQMAVSRMESQDKIHDDIADAVQELLNERKHD